MPDIPLDDLFPESLSLPARPARAGPSLLDRVILGTSGYSFRDWVGPFYPSGTTSGQFLPYYARHFDAVEVNSTYYRIPDPGVTARMAAKTPDGFRFVVKLNHAMTHEESAEPSLYRDFLACCAPFEAAGKLDGLLAQFPWGFRHSPRAREHLVRMRGLLGEHPLWAEFRHDSWLQPDLGDFLRHHHIGYCDVDEPRLRGLLPPVGLVTSEDAYVRLHGRNAQNWWGSEGGDRYDYDYSEPELREWVERLRKLAEQARKTYLFFNNCHAGQAARNAKLMQELLKQQKLPG
jgi:uncharacterized protein YecE (DUF72 family)